MFRFHFGIVGDDAFFQKNKIFLFDFDDIFLVQDKVLFFETDVVGVVVVGDKIQQRLPVDVFLVRNGDLNGNRGDFFFFFLFVGRSDGVLNQGFQRVGGKILFRVFYRLLHERRHNFKQHIKQLRDEKHVHHFKHAAIAVVITIVNAITIAVVISRTRCTF